MAISSFGAVLQGFGTEQIDRLVTLGSPHQAPPKVRCACFRHHVLPQLGQGIRLWLPSTSVSHLQKVSYSQEDALSPMFPQSGYLVQDLKLVDQTRGILTWVTDNVPGNFHQEVGYATVSTWQMRCAEADALQDLSSMTGPASFSYEPLAHVTVTHTRDIVCCSHLSTTSDALQAYGDPWTE